MPQTPKLPPGYVLDSSEPALPAVPSAVQNTKLPPGYTLDLSYQAPVIAQSTPPHGFWHWFTTPPRGSKQYATIPEEVRSEISNWAGMHLPSSIAPYAAQYLDVVSTPLASVEEAGRRLASPLNLLLMGGTLGAGAAIPALAESAPLVAKAARVAGPAMGGVFAAQGARQAASGFVPGLKTPERVERILGGAGNALLGGAGAAESFRPLPPDIAATVRARDAAESNERGIHEFLKSKPSGTTEKFLAEEGKPDEQGVLKQLASEGHLREIAKSEPKSYEQAYNATREHMQNFFQNTVEEAAQRHADSPVDMSPVAGDIRSLHNSEIEKFFPESADTLEEEASRFENNKTTVRGAFDLLQKLNAMSRRLEAVAPADRAAAEKINATSAALDKATDGVRNQLYKTLADYGEKGIPEAQAQYGQLMELRKVLYKNISRSIRAEAAKPSLNPLAVARGTFASHDLGTAVAIGGLAAASVDPKAALVVPGLYGVEYWKRLALRGDTPNARLAAAFREWSKGPELKLPTSYEPLHQLGTKLSGVLSPGGMGPYGFTPEGGFGPLERPQPAITVHPTTRAERLGLLLPAGEGAGPYPMPPSPLSPVAGSETTFGAARRGYTNTEPQPPFAWGGSVHSVPAEPAIPEYMRTGRALPAASSIQAGPSTLPQALMIRPSESLTAPPLPEGAPRVIGPAFSPNPVAVPSAELRSIELPRAPETAPVLEAARANRSKLKPLHDTRFSVSKAWDGNVSGSPDFVTDGSMMIPRGAVAAQKMLDRMSGSKGSRMVEAAKIDDFWAKAASAPTRRAEVIGTLDNKDGLPAAYLQSGNEMVPVDARKLRFLEKVTRYDSIGLSGPGNPVILYRNNAPVAALMPLRKAPPVSLK